MASLFDKIKVLLSASFHDLVDKALKGDPIKTLNEYLRQHDEAIQQVVADLGEVGGKVKTSTRLLNEVQAKVDGLLLEIERTLTDADPLNDYMAENLSQNLVEVEEQQKVYADAQQSALRSQKALSFALNKLKQRRNSLANQIQLLDAIKFEADIKTLSADRLIQSARLLNSGSASVEALAETIKENRDKADAKFDVALEQLATQTEDSMSRQAATRLDKIRQRLGVDMKPTDASDQETSLEVTAEELELFDSAGSATNR